MIQHPTLSALDKIRHGFFTRRDGFSTGLYESRNCGFGSDDEAENVARNRAACMARLSGEAPDLVTVHQTHSADVAVVETPWPHADAPRADALVTDRPGIALGILTADCAPVLFADGEAQIIGAAHAGWKGALGGVTDATLAAMARLGAKAERIVAVVGPRIGADSYEVGPEFRERFVADDAANDRCFAPSPRAGHFLFDLGFYIAGRLERAGVGRIALSAHDTLKEEDLFFSYRRSCLRGEGDYGRGLSAILLEG